MGSKHKSSQWTISNHFPLCLVARLTKLTSLGTSRLTKKSRRLKAVIEEYLLKAHTFLYPMEDATGVTISKKNYAFGSLEQAQEDNQ